MLRFLQKISTPNENMLFFKRLFTAAMVLTIIIASENSVYSQHDQSAAIKESADTLNTKIENVKSDLDLLKKLKISGYVQAQWQLADNMGQLSPFSAGNFPKNADNRFMLRRGRVKFTYEGKLTQFVLQIDATQSGVSLKDAYLNFKEPWLQSFSVQAGVFNRPFGYEIAYSSSNRETPERARITQALFPGERDLGAMLSFQPRKESRFNFIRLNAGVIAGNAIAPEIDSHKDFVGQLGINRTTRSEKFRYGIGVSYYNGGFFQETKYVYNTTTLENGMMGFAVDSTDSNKGEYAKREYYGVDAQFSLDWKLGMTTLRGEYIMGKQPGSATATGGSASNVSPNSRVIPLPATSGGPIDTYNREFSGAYVYFIQNILHSRHEIVVKYDFYDPNTEVSGTEVASKVNYNDETLNTYMNSADIKFTTWGLGYNVRIATNVKLMAYYEFVKNENTIIKGYSQDVEDNVLTIRAQFKF
jgi:hypothetical protein